MAKGEDTGFAAYAAKVVICVAGPVTAALTEQQQGQPGDEQQQQQQQWAKSAAAATIGELLAAVEARLAELGISTDAADDALVWAGQQQHNGQQQQQPGQQQEPELQQQQVVPDGDASDAESDGSGGYTPASEMSEDAYEQFAAPLVQQPQSDGQVLRQLLRVLRDSIAALNGQQQQQHG